MLTGRPDALLDEMLHLRHEVLREGRELFDEWRPHISRRAFVLSAYNLANYLALRRRDLRALQLQLARWGLSSLGRSEARVKPNLDAVTATLGAICHSESPDLPRHPRAWLHDRGARLLTRETQLLFGPMPTPRDTRIMVTMPPEAATDPTLAQALVQRHVESVRINCAHDSADAWVAMIRLLREAEQAAGCTQPTRILMDLGGPKVRTIRPKNKAGKTRFKVGDRLLLARNIADTQTDDVPIVGCTLPAVFDQLREGAQVWIDDGQIGARVVSLRADGALLQVSQAPPKGKKIRPEKGMNFPDTDLQVTPLTAKDREDLDFVAANADMVGYSFVQSAEDVALLQEELLRRVPSGRTPPALVMKIETHRAVQNLPEIIVQAGSRLPTAVMIARGDLAVELGYERMAEIQEEMLWLCEAAYVPVIWATQVLESLAKEGVPSRAEVSDAAMADRAECVMLNKGPFIVSAVELLDDVLLRMQGHQQKKTPQLRALRSWVSLFEPVP